MLNHIVEGVQPIQPIQPIQLIQPKNDNTALHDWDHPVNNSPFHKDTEEDFFDAYYEVLKRDSLRLNSN